MVILHCATRTPNFLLCWLFSHNKRSFDLLLFGSLPFIRHNKRDRLDYKNLAHILTATGSVTCISCSRDRKTFAQDLVRLVINRRRGRERNGKVGLENGKICDVYADLGTSGSWVKKCIPKVDVWDPRWCFRVVSSGGDRNSQSSTAIIHNCSISTSCTTPAAIEKKKSTVLTERMEWLNYRKSTPLSEPRNFITNWPKNHSKHRGFWGQVIALVYPLLELPSTSPKKNLSPRLF